MPLGGCGIISGSFITSINEFSEGSGGGGGGGGGGVDLDISIVRKLVDMGQG